MLHSTNKWSVAAERSGSKNIHKRHTCGTSNKTRFLGGFFISFFFLLLLYCYLNLNSNWWLLFTTPDLNGIFQMISFIITPSIFSFSFLLFIFGFLAFVWNIQNFTDLKFKTILFKLKMNCANSMSVCEYKYMCEFLWIFYIWCHTCAHTHTKWLIVTYLYYI